MADRHALNSSEVNPTSLSYNSSSLRDQANNSLKRSVIENYQHDKYSSLTLFPLLQLFFFQTFATLIFIYGLTCIHPNASTGQMDILISLAIFMAVAINAHLSGANLNPMITLSQCIRKENKYRRIMFGVYFVAQFYGTFLGLLLGQLLNGTKLPPFMPLTEDFIGCSQVILSQLIGIFILVFFVLLISNPNTTFIDDELSGFVFITAFVHMGRKFAPSSGNLINVCVSICVNVLDVTRGDYSGLKYLPLWIVGDLLGTILATLFYEKLFEPNVSEIRRKRRESENSTYQDLYESQRSYSDSLIRPQPRQMMIQEEEDDKVEEQKSQDQEKEQ